MIVGSQLARRWSGRVARQVQAAEQLAAGIVAAEAAALLAGNEMAREQQVRFLGLVRVWVQS